MNGSMEHFLILFMDDGWVGGWRESDKMMGLYDDTTVGI